VISRVAKTAGSAVGAVNSPRTVETDDAVLAAKIDVQPRTWACGGIVYVLGRINFLADPSFPPHMTTAELCAAFQVGETHCSRQGAHHRKRARD
jgi:Domain of unknown function (DUF6398)